MGEPAAVEPAAGEETPTGAGWVSASQRVGEAPVRSLPVQEMVAVRDTMQLPADKRRRVEVHRREQRVALLFVGHDERDAVVIPGRRGRVGEERARPAGAHVRTDAALESWLRTTHPSLSECGGWCAKSLGRRSPPTLDQR
jgi:hypothetical protein